MVAFVRHQCQFSGESCSTESAHYRKVISHIFGRNKKCTVNVPDSVWIYYCRKHYQRARYRTGEWPFRQCDLAIDTIRNMRAWGGVESFNLKLRRRESQRPPDEFDGNYQGHQHNESAPSSASKEYPGQNSLAQDLPASTSSETGNFAAINAQSPSTSEEPVIPKDSDTAGDHAAAERSGDQQEMQHTSDGNRGNAKKRSPKSIPRPVPDWLHDRVGNHISFDDTLQTLHDLRAHLLQVTGNGKDAHFPDIEILPNLRRQPPCRPVKGGQGSRVSGRGSIIKVEKK